MEPTVKEWMTGDPVALDADASALEALDLMVDRGIRHLPVLDAAHRVVGVVSLDDLRAALPGSVSLRAPLSAAERSAALEWRVADVMSHAPLTIGEEAGLGEAAERMAEARIGCLPVVGEDGRLAAILSETDLLHALATRLWAESRSAPREREPADALAKELARERDRLRSRLAAEGPAGALAAPASRRLEALEHALERAAAGKLERCEGCGGRIPATRLRALPGTTLCVRCARDRVTE
jgi:acetoin utilization protein AcuB